MTIQITNPSLIPQTPALHAYQIAPPPKIAMRQAAKGAKTPEKTVFGAHSGTAAVCCTPFTSDELAVGISRPSEQNNADAHTGEGWTHIPTGSEIPLAATAGYLSLGGLVIGGQIARDFKTKQDGLRGAAKKIANYNVQSPDTPVGKAQCHAKAATAALLKSRGKRARFEKLVNGRGTQFTSVAMLAGRFIPIAQTVGLTGLAINSFANVAESYKEFRDSTRGLARAQKSHYKEYDDSAVRAEAFREKRGLLFGNMASWVALGAGSSIIAAADIAAKVAPSGLGVLPGLGTIIGLPGMLAGIAGTMVFNNKKNNDAHGATLSHEFIDGITLDTNGNVTSLMTHSEVRKKNIESFQKRNTLNHYRSEVYKHRGLNTFGRSFSKFMIRAEHATLRWGHKAATLLTLGLLPQITRAKDSMRDHILRHNTGDTIGYKRLDALMVLQGRTEADRIDELSEYKEESSRRKLTRLINTVRMTPDISDAIGKKALSRLAIIDDARGTYRDADDTEHSYLKLKKKLRSEMLKGTDHKEIVIKSLNEEAVRLRSDADKMGSDPSANTLREAATALEKGRVVEACKLAGHTRLDRLNTLIYKKNYKEAAQKILSNDLRALFAKSTTQSVFQVINKLSGKYGEQATHVLLRELQRATDHVLIFSAHKDARRQIIGYSELSDRFEKVKRENRESLSYTEDTSSRSDSEIRAGVSLCADPKCTIPHFGQSKARTPIPIQTKGGPFCLPIAS